jgi:tungstate transport system permease protein
MALPPVVVGLLLYIIFSNQGVLGSYNLLYTVNAMIIAQTILITPILISLSQVTLERYYQKYNNLLLSMHASYIKRLATLIWEAKYALIINLLVGFGRALSEVGAIIIVGGNIAHLTRTMTTGIVLETSRGDLASAMSLGITLITIALFVNIILYSLKAYGEKNLV